MAESFLKETIDAALGKVENPVYRRELGGWSQIRLWRDTRRGCLPAIALFLLVMISCCGLSGLASGLNTPEFAIILILYLFLAVYITGELVRIGANLLATTLTSTTLSAEVEAQTFTLLRVTNLTPRQIVLGKFGGAIQQLRLPILVSTGIRAFFMVVGGLALLALSSLGLLGAFLESSGLAGGAPRLEDLVFSAAALVPILCLGGLGLAFMLLSLAYFLLQPMLDACLYAALGMFASGLARTRANGLAMGFAGIGALWLLLPAIRQILGIMFSGAIFALSTLPMFAAAFLDNSIASATFGAFSTAVSVLIAVVLGFVMAGIKIALTFALLRGAAGRAAVLPFGTG